MDDELEVLSAIFSLPGELHISPDGCGGKHVTLKMRSLSEASQPSPEVMLVFVLASTYPFSSPDVSVFCSSLSHAVIKVLRDRLKAHVDAHQGMPVLMELVAITQQMMQDLPQQEPAVAMPTQDQNPNLNPNSASVANSTHGMNSAPISTSNHMSNANMSLPNHMSSSSRAIQANRTVNVNHSTNAGYAPVVSSNPNSSPSHALNSIHVVTPSQETNPNLTSHANHAKNNGAGGKSKHGVSPSQNLVLSAMPDHSHSEVPPYSHPGTLGHPVSMETAVMPDSEGRDFTTLLLYLDHMRSRPNYVKLIARWTQDLWLTGRLFFCDKLILILLQGAEGSIKSYLKWHRTENVDVDSRGRPCKEKMMTVLRETNEIKHRFVDFQVIECSSRAELEKLFEVNGMGDLYQQCVCIPSRIKTK